MVEQTTVCYLFDKDTCLLLHRIKKHQDVNKGKWIGIGGHIEDGETPLDCVIREYKEETGLTPGNVRCRGELTFIYNGEESEHIYVYTASSFTGRLIDCDEGELKWVPVKEIPSLNLWEGDRLFLPLLPVENKPYFFFRLCYDGDTLTSYEYSEEKSI